MNINSLPDLCLRTIFANLPLRDLLRIDMVCVQWKELQPSVCRTVKTVVIVVGDDAVGLLKDSRFQIPHYEEVQQEGQVVEYKPFSSADEWHLLEFDWLDEGTTEFMIDMMPNITSAQISLRGIQPTICIGEKSWGRKSIALKQVIALLEAWSPKLENLKLCTSFTDYIQQDHLERDMPRLLASINQLQVVKKLDLELQNMFYYDAPKKPLDLPVLARLEEFYLDYVDPTDLVYDSLLKYGKDNDSLRRIGFSNIYDSDLSNEFFNKANHAAFYAKFNLFPSLEFSEPTEAMRLFCERFSSLRRISLSIHNMPMITKMMRHLRPLRELVYLDLNISFDEEGGRARGEEEDVVRRVPQLPSVKILNIYAPLNKHTDLYELQWHVMLPNLEVLHYHDGWADCQICMPPDDEDDDEESNNGDQDNANNNDANNDQLDEGQNIDWLFAMDVDDNEAEDNMNAQAANNAEAANVPDIADPVVPVEVPNNEPVQMDEDDIQAENNDETRREDANENNVNGEGNQNDNQNGDAMGDNQNNEGGDNENNNGDNEDEESDPEDDKRAKCLRLCLHPWRYCDNLQKIYTGDSDDPKLWTREELWSEE